MRRLGYGLGIGVLIVGAAIGLAELLTILQGSPSTLSLGAIWYRIHANSLVGFQARIEQGLAPAVWPPIQWILTVPSWLILVPLGLILLVACWPRARS